MLMPRKDSYYRDARVVENMNGMRVDGGLVTINRPPLASDAFNQLSDAIDSYVGVNPIGLIWEVLPFSWAVDWLLSVDDVLDNLFLQASSRFNIQYWTSVKYQYDREVEYKFVEAVSGYPDMIEQLSQCRLLKQSVSYYLRDRVDPPSLIESSRLRGSSVYHVFLLGLVALGFRK